MNGTFYFHSDFYVYYLPSDNVNGEEETKEKSELSTQINPSRDLTGEWEGNARWQNNVINPACAYEGIIIFNLITNENKLIGNWQTIINKANPLLKDVPCSQPGVYPLTDLIGTISSSEVKFSSGNVNFKGTFTSDLFKGTFESCPNQICSDGSRAVGFIGEFTAIRKR